MSKIFQIISPGTGEVFAERKYHSQNQIDATLEKAASAFKPWKNTSVEDRALICRKAVEYVVSKAEPWGKEISQMMGRPIKYSAVELNGGFPERANYMINIAASTLSHIYPPEKEGFTRFIKRDPLGVILALAPWNYPYLTSVNVVIPAIMAGNSVILKHADQTALCAERYLEAFEAAGLPEGVFQFLHMDHEQVASVIENPTIAFVAFTGSVSGGHAIQKAAGSRFMSTGLELGGKDPAYVCEDADIDYTVENLVDGSFFNSGQSCCGIERIYVHQSIFDQFVEQFVALTKQYKIDDPLSPTTTLGPMVRVSNAQKAIAQFEEAISKGAKALIDPDDFPNLKLPYLAPQVLIEVDHSMAIMKEESFAPLIGIMPVASDEAAIKLMNDSDYGLTASIWTSDEARAIAVGQAIETGTWYMNRCDYLDPALAWTGVKNSGKGCTLSAIGYESLTRPKSFHLKKV